MFLVFISICLLAHSQAKPITETSATATAATETTATTADLVPEHHDDGEVQIY